MALVAVSIVPQVAVFGTVFGSDAATVVQTVRVPLTFLSPITPQCTLFRLKPASWLLRLKVWPEVSDVAWPRSRMKSLPLVVVNPISKSPEYVAARVDAAIAKTAAASNTVRTSFFIQANNGAVALWKIAIIRAFASPK